MPDDDDEAPTEWEVTLTTVVPADDESDAIQRAVEWAASTGTDDLWDATPLFDEVPQPEPEALDIAGLITAVGGRRAFDLADALRLAAVAVLPPWPGLTDGHCPGHHPDGRPCDRTDSIHATDLKISWWAPDDVTRADNVAFDGHFEWSDGDGDHIVCTECRTRWALPENVNYR
jgi:hypothetical protein